MAIWNGLHREKFLTIETVGMAGLIKQIGHLQLREDEVLPNYFK